MSVELLAHDARQLIQSIIGATPTQSIIEAARWIAKDVESLPPANVIDVRGGDRYEQYRQDRIRLRADVINKRKFGDLYTGLKPDNVRQMRLALILS